MKLGLRIHGDPKLGRVAFAFNYFHLQRIVSKTSALNVSEDDRAPLTGISSKRFKVFYSNQLYEKPGNIFWTYLIPSAARRSVGLNLNARTYNTGSKKDLQPKKSHRRWLRRHMIMSNRTGVLPSTTLWLKLLPRAAYQSSVTVKHLPSNTTQPHQEKHNYNAKQLHHHNTKPLRLFKHHRPLSPRVLIKEQCLVLRQLSVQHLTTAPDGTP